MPVQVNEVRSSWHSKIEVGVRQSEGIVRGPDGLYPDNVV